MRNRRLRLSTKHRLRPWSEFVDNATGSGTFAADFNNDEPGTVVISDVNYSGPLTMTFDSDTINFHDGATLVYHLDLTSTDYTVTVDDAPEGGTVSSPLDFGALQSGSPQEFLAPAPSDGVLTRRGETARNAPRVQARVAATDEIVYRNFQELLEFVIGDVRDYSLLWAVRRRTSSLMPRRSSRCLRASISPRGGAD